MECTRTATDSSGTRNSRYQSASGPLYGPRFSGRYPLLAAEGPPVLARSIGSHSKFLPQSVAGKPACRALRKQGVVYRSREAVMLSTCSLASAPAFLVAACALWLSPRSEWGSPGHGPGLGPLEQLHRYLRIEEKPEWMRIQRP